MGSSDRPVHSTSDTAESTGEHLQRNLANRHIQLIAIGGAIGTGLFMGSGKTISKAGPSILLVYLTVGIMLFFVMRALGELLLHNLNYKSFQDFTADMLGAWAGFFTGWTYWMCWVVTGMAEIVAVTGYWEFWTHSRGSAVLLALATLLVLLGLNVLSVRLFGEMEFWFAIIKVIAIVVLIGMGLWMLITGFRSPDGSVASVSHLWNDGGVFPMGASGFFAGFQIAIFAFVGIELVGTTAAETKDPTKTLPRAINSIPIRVILFYVGALFVIMCVTPWRQVDPNRSPFVNLFTLAGLAAAAGVMNFVVLSSASSSCNSGIYSTSRMLYGLSHKRMAWRGFGRLSKANVPVFGLFLSVLLISTSLLLMLSESVMSVFTMVTTVASVLFLFVWTLILLSYIVYRRRYPQAHAASAYKMPGARTMPYVVLAFFAFVLVLLTQEQDTFDAMKYTPIWFVLLYVLWRSTKGHVIADDSTTEVPVGESARH